MLTKKSLKQRLIDIRNGAFVTPILEEIWEEINIADKMDKFIEKIPIENQAKSQMILGDFYDYLITGKMPYELDALEDKLCEEAREDYKKGRTYTHEEIFKAVSDCCSAPMIVKDDEEINGIHTKKYVCDKCKKDCDYQLEE